MATLQAHELERAAAPPTQTLFRRLAHPPPALCTVDSRRLQAAPECAEAMPGDDGAARDALVGVRCGDVAEERAEVIQGGGGFAEGRSEAIQGGGYSVDDDLDYIQRGDNTEECAKAMQGCDDDADYDLVVVQRDGVAGDLVEASQGCGDTAGDGLDGAHCDDAAQNRAESMQGCSGVANDNADCGQCDHVARERSETKQCGGTADKVDFVSAENRRLMQTAQPTAAALCMSCSMPTVNAKGGNRTRKKADDETSENNAAHDILEEKSALDNHEAKKANDHNGDTVVHQQNEGNVVDEIREDMDVGQHNEKNAVEDITIPELGSASTSKSRRRSSGRRAQNGRVRSSRQKRPRPRSSAKVAAAFGKPSKRLKENKRSVQGASPDQPSPCRLSQRIRISRLNAFDHKEKTAPDSFSQELSISPAYVQSAPQQKHTAEKEEITPQRAKSIQKSGDEAFCQSGKLQPRPTSASAKRKRVSCGGAQTLRTKYKKPPLSDHVRKYFSVIGSTVTLFSRGMLQLYLNGERMAAYKRTLEGKPGVEPDLADILSASKP